MKRIFLFFALFLYVLGPIVNTPLGLYGDPILLISLFLFVLGFLKKYLNRQDVYAVIKDFKSPFLIFLFYLIFPLYCCLLFPEYGTNFLSEFIKPIRILLTLYGGLILVLFYRNCYGELFFYILLKHILYIMVINAFIMFGQTFNPTFRAFIETTLYRIDDGVYRYGLDLRSSGLYLSGGALPSAIQTLVTIFIPLLVRKKILNIYWGLFLVSILFSTSLLTGRTGVFAFLPYIVLSFFLFTRKQRIKEVVFLGCLLIGFITLSLSFFEGNDAFVHVLDRFARLEGYIDKNSSSSDPTFKLLLGKLSVPENILIFLFGTLGFSNIIYSRVSDMGFNISLWRYGIIGFMLFYYPFLKMFNTVKKVKFRFFRYERLMVIYFLLTYLLFEFKENMMYARNGLSILSLVVFGYIFYRNRVIANVNESSYTYK